MYLFHKSVNKEYNFLLLPIHSDLKSQALLMMGYGQTHNNCSLFYYCNEPTYTECYSLEAVQVIIIRTSILTDESSGPSAVNSLPEILNSVPDQDMSD